MNTKGNALATAPVARFPERSTIRTRSVIRVPFRGMFYLESVVATDELDFDSRRIRYTFGSSHSSFDSY